MLAIRRGGQFTSLGNQYGSVSGAQNLVRSSFGSAAVSTDPKPPTVVLSLPNGVCFGDTTPALDVAGQRLYYTELERYAYSGSTPFLAVLDLATGTRRRINVAGLLGRSAPSFQKLRLSDDGRTLWSHACFSGNNGCAYRLVVVGNITATVPHDDRFMNATSWETTLPGLSATDRPAAGLSDYAIRKQPNSTSFVFIAYHSGRPYGRPVRGVYEGNAVPGGIATIKSLLQPIDVKAVDIDHTDAEHGLLVAPFPPDSTVLPVSRQLDGLLLLRGPTAGVGKPDGKTMTPKIIPWYVNFDVILTSWHVHSQLYATPTRAVCCTPLSAHADRVLIGACDPDAVTKSRLRMPHPYMPHPML